jgi:hypothetical protein
MPTVSHKPWHYVAFLTDPGLSTNAGRVPLKRYMSFSKGNAEIAALFAALNESGIRDTDSGQTAMPVKDKDEWNIMWKGQGYHPYFITLWNWLWDNQEQLRDSKNVTLNRIYAKYFAPNAPRGKPNPIAAMVEDHYFGIECIGFVSNYLRYTGVWNSYRGVANHSWSIHFKQKIYDLKDVQPLDLLEWTDVGHIALVDDVYDITSGKLKLDVSQCSGFPGGENGPMTNEGVYLSGGGGEFSLSGKVPVTGSVEVRRMENLTYKAESFQRTPIEGTAAQTYGYPT